MIQLERTAVMNLENAMRGARNPMNSWARSDSYYNEEQEYILGPNDLDLARRLCLAGSDHRKFLRQIFVSVDITRMKEFVAYLETVRLRYVETKDKALWYDLIQLLPSSYNQLRTCTLNYETLTNIYYARKNHKLDEWHVVCDWIRGLPYAKEMILVRENEV